MTSFIYNIRHKFYDLQYEETGLTSFALYTIVINRSPVYGTIALKTMTETVTIRRKRQRAGDSGSPVRVTVCEDHSQVAG